MSDVNLGDLRGSKSTRPDTKIAFYMHPTDVRHGTSNGYNNLGCRCARCKRAWADYHIRYLNSHPVQRTKAAHRELKYTALRNGHQSRAEYEQARLPYYVSCPFCDWEIVVPPSWIKRYVSMPGYVAHVRKVHPALVERAILVHSSPFPARIAQ